MNFSLIVRTRISIAEERNTFKTMRWMFQTLQKFRILCNESWEAKYSVYLFVLGFS